MTSVCVRVCTCVCARVCVRAHVCAHVCARVCARAHMHVEGEGRGPVGREALRSQLAQEGRGRCEGMKGNEWMCWGLPQGSPISFISLVCVVLSRSVVSDSLQPHGL